MCTIKIATAPAIVTTLLGVSPAKPPRIRVRSGVTTIMVPLSELGNPIDVAEAHAKAALMFCRNAIDIKGATLLQSRLYDPDQFVFVVMPSDETTISLQAARESA